MTWQNAWVLSGLALVALPILIHLLSQKRAVQQKFPSLRFLDVSRLLPTRSPNLTDIPLMLVRMAIVAMAAFALAQPLFLSAARKQSLNAALARVIVVDTSRSMQRALGTTTAADSARRIATTMAGEASASTVLQTANPSSVLQGAIAWLHAQSGRGEVVIVSDFQYGAVDAQTLSVIPSELGVRTVRLSVAPSVASLFPFQSSRTLVTTFVDSARVQAEWKEAARDVSASLTLLTRPDDAATARAAYSAAIEVVAPALRDTSKHTAIVFPGAAELSSVASAAKDANARWMTDALLDVERNPMLREAAMNEPVSDTVIAAPFAVVARNGAGAPVAYAGLSTVNGAPHLVFVSRAPVSSVSSAAIIAAVTSSVALPTNVSENVNAFLAEGETRAFDREARSVEDSAERQAQSTKQSGLSDGRWFWVAALLLLGVEALMRRRTPAAVAVS